LLALADVAVVVSNAKASAKWWVRNLGFATYTIGGTGHAVLVAPPEERFVLHLCQGFAPIEPGNSGIAFVTDDIDSMVAKMTRSGVIFPEPLRKEKWGKMAKFADPDGNVFWLLEAPRSMMKGAVEARAVVPKKTPSRRATRSKRP